MQVQLAQISLALAGRNVLSGLNLLTESNEYVVILGPSGCGKTTTLRILAGLQKPDSGEVLFEGRSVTKIRPRRRDVSLVFQNDGLYPHLTVRKSIELGLPKNVGETVRRQRIQHAVELTRLGDLLDRYPDQLSGGELRRAAVAKAVARACPLRLLDEPLSALDVSARQSLQDDLSRWHREVVGTTIHVTHDGEEAVRMADRIAVLDAGYIRQFDSPVAIYRQPQSISVARAIGSPSINLIPARIQNNQMVSLEPTIQLRLDRSSLGPDRDVLVGIRPDALRVHALETPDPGCSATLLQGKLLGVSPNLQSRDSAGLLLGNKDSPCRVRVELGHSVVHGVGEDLSSLSKRVGQSIHLRADDSDLHVFDAGDGQRIDVKTT